MRFNSVESLLSVMTSGDVKVIFFPPKLDSIAFFLLSIFKSIWLLSCSDWEVSVGLAQPDWSSLFLATSKARGFSSQQY